MSSQYRKIEYVTQGNWASTEKRHLLIHYNNTSDVVLVYDEKGEYMFSFDEWGLGDEINKGEALVIALTNFNDSRLIPLTPEEIKLIRR